MQFIILALGNKLKIKPILLKFNNSLSVKTEDELFSSAIRSR